MVSLPTPNLVRTLHELQICTPTELRRCRSHVKRLARELPDFDSVWIDVLVQQGALTGFQARCLEENGGSDLSVGQWVLENRLDSATWGSRPPQTAYCQAATFLARHRSTGSRGVLKIISVPPQRKRESEAALAFLAGVGKSTRFPQMAVPRNCFADGEFLVTASPFIEGPHLGELLIRRGRFPAEIVSNIAIQLLAGLTVLHEAGLIHGDLRRETVRLTQNGLVVAVDVGISPAISPEMIVRPDDPPEIFDGIAPERIASGHADTSASDLFAAGALLWQLLTARPPFPTGDALAKLAAHQTEEFQLVEHWAPETPARLAEFIRHLTRPNPTDRPATAREALSMLVGRSRSASDSLRQGGASLVTPTQRSLKHFGQSFQTNRLRMPEPPSSGKAWRWSLTTVAIFALSGIAFWMSDQGLRSTLLSIGGSRGGSENVTNLPSSQNHGTNNGKFSEQSGPVLPESSLLPLPAPDIDGLILLTTDGPYSVAELNVADSLEIRGLPGKRPVVEVHAEPLRIYGEKVSIRNVHFRQVSPVSRHPEYRERMQSVSTLLQQQPVPMLAVRADIFTATECSFVDVARSSSDAVLLRSQGLQWTPLDEQNPTAGIIKLENSLFLCDTAIDGTSALRRVECRNCLFLGTGVAETVVHLTTSNQGRAMTRLSLLNSTLRDLPGLIRLQNGAESSQPQKIQVDHADSVLRLTGRDAAIVHFCTTSLKRSEVEVVQIVGEGTLLQANVPVGRWIPPDDRPVKTLQADAIAVEGLATPNFRFKGGKSLRPADSELLTFEGPRRGDQLPGIQGSAIPSAIPNAEDKFEKSVSPYVDSQN